MASKLPILTFSLFLGSFLLFFSLIQGGNVLEAQNGPSELKRFEFQGVEMAVPIRIVLYAPDEETAKRASDAALGRFRDLNARLSDYDENSEIRQFCDKAFPGEFVCVGEDLWTVLQLAVHHAELSEGAFDPTVGQVVRLWRHARKSRRLPPEKRICETLQTVGWENILFDPEKQAIALSEHGAKYNVRLDLGGIAKGYAIDEALETMRILGVSRALVDAGGDVGVGDPPPGTDGWKIGVASIREGEGPTEFWTLSNCGVANSGDMYQYVEIGGKRYSHIVDPKTGLGLTDRLSVSVIAPTAANADALASAFSVLGPEKAVRLAETLEGVQTRIHRLAEDGNVQRFGNVAE